MLKPGNETTDSNQVDGVAHVELGIRRSFDDLYRKESRALVAVAYGLSGSRRAAEELVQEAFIAAYRQWEKVGAYDDPAAWLRRVVANLSVSRVRRRLAEARALTRLWARTAVLPQVLPERDDVVWRAVRSLPTRQAQVVVLHYVDDRPLLEIAQLLGCSEGSVKRHLHRARQTLATTLENPNHGDAT